MKVAIIPARGGSVRIPRKNIRPFFGKPIMAYSIDTARRSGLFDGGVYVSTEDPEIARIALEYGAQVIHRPLNLAEMNGAPDCGTQEVTRHAIAILQWEMKVDYACCIYPTAPLMTEGNLRLAFEQLERQVSGFVFSVGPDYRDAGQFYWGDAMSFLNREPLGSPSSGRYVLPDDLVADINTEDDWKRAEQLYANIHGVTASEPA